MASPVQGSLARVVIITIMFIAWQPWAGHQPGDFRVYITGVLLWRFLLQQSHEIVSKRPKLRVSSVCSELCICYVCVCVYTHISLRNINDITLTRQ